MATYSRGLTIDARSVVNSFTTGLGSGSDFTIYTVPSERVLRVTYFYWAVYATWPSAGPSSMTGTFEIDGQVFNQVTQSTPSPSVQYGVTYDFGGTMIEFGPGAVLSISNTSSATGIDRGAVWRWNGVLYAIG